jgi:hypothetical protein
MIEMRVIGMYFIWKWDGIGWVTLEGTLYYR